MKIKTKNPNKWDLLYSEKKSWFAKLEETAINWYFAKVFGKSIMAIHHVKNGQILESGCGSGAISMKLSEHNNEIFLLDLSPNALARAISNFRKASIDCKFVITDLFKMPFGDNQFDIVFNQGVMEHFKITGVDPTPGIKEMLRVVKQNGILVISVPAYFSPLHIIYLFFKIFGLVEKFWPYEDQEFSHKKELFQMLKAGGCTNIKVRRIWSSLFFSLIGYCKKE